ncbi:hypothetical protein LAZ67_4004347 [Cordylochernes scorpioides]|uniref:Uncharacterized protein n=1 Tax=Cordylochernes scorpioides TaxID=51811 RepID=A0ABY6KED0_9ARAC|nr:hypothetical protein LAZ67_4004347 [Cordylochernes scorpioides]
MIEYANMFTNFWDNLVAEYVPATSSVYELLGQPCSRVRTRHLEVGFGHGRAHGGEHGAHVVALVLPLDVRYGERAVSGHGEPAVRPFGEHKNLGALPRPEHGGRWLTRGYTLKFRHRGQTGFLTLIWPILTYGCESWTLVKSSIKRIEAFETYLYRRTIKIPWTDIK